MNEQTLEQQRAKDAWDKVISLPGVGDNKPDDKAHDYARHVKKLPARIRTAGLGQALAFLAAKEQTDLTRHLSGWVLLQCGKPVKGDLLAEIMRSNSDFLMHATAEALAWLQWAKRFCEAKQLGKEDQDREER